MDRFPLSCNIGRFRHANELSSGLSYSVGGICRASASGMELSSKFWTGQTYLRVDTPARQVQEDSAFVVTARIKVNKGQQKDVIPHRELLAQERGKKKLTWLLREQELLQPDSEVEKIWPFWRKKKKDEMAARALTARIMQLSKRQQLSQVFDLLDAEKKEGRELSIIVMNAVVEACVQCDDVDSAVSVYQEMIRSGNCGVDNITYGILLKGLGRAQKLDEAFELIEAVEAGTAPGNPVLSDVHVNTLVNACVEAGDSLRARGVMLRYRSAIQGSRPSILNYNLLIKGFSRSGNPLEALKVKDEMLAQDVQPQRLTYNSLIFACVRGGNMDEAVALFTEMKAEARRLRTSRLLPDVVTYTTLLKGFGEAGDVERISKLVLEMQRSPTCVLDRVAYSSIIDAFINSGSPQEGLRFFTQEVNERAKVEPQLRPRAHVYLALMRAFASKGNMEVVNSLRQQMVPNSSGKVCPEDRAEADELLIETAVNSGQLGVAREVLKSMIGIRKGIPLSRRAHLAIVRLQALLGFSHELFRPLLLKSGLSPQGTVETIMIRYNEARPINGNVLLKDVAMRFFEQDAIPIVDDIGACIGVVHREDCFEMSAKLRDMSRGAPEVTTSTSILRAVSLLLEPGVHIVIVVSSRTAYTTERRFSREIPLGFVTREAIFSQRDLSQTDNCSRQHPKRTVRPKSSM